MSHTALLPSDILSGMSALHRATAADIAELEYHEVVGGKVVRKAAPSGEHARIQYRVGGKLFGFDQDEGKPGGWWLATECEIELEPHEVYLPDLAGWRVTTSREPPQGKPVQVAPDWVCEVLSPSTAKHDVDWKQRAYHRARIGHFWIINPFHRTLLVLRWQDTGYVVALAADADDAVRTEPFDAIELDLSRLL